MYQQKQRFKLKWMTKMVDIQTKGDAEVPSFMHGRSQALSGPELDNNVACSADACRFKSRLEISPLSIWGRRSRNLSW